MAAVETRTIGPDEAGMRLAPVTFTRNSGYGREVCPAGAAAPRMTKVATVHAVRDLNMLIGRLPDDYRRTVMLWVLGAFSPGCPPWT